MSPLSALLMDPTTLTLARVLVHFLWQGAVLALVAFAATRWLTTSASARYVIGFATLAAMLVAPFVTFAVLQSSPAAVSTAITRSPLIVAAIDASPGLAADAAARTSTAAIPSTLPIVVLAWLLGVAVLSVRLVGGWIVARRLVRRAVGPVTPDVQRLAHQVAERLQLRRLVRIVESSTVSVPMMVGWLKPVVLLPAAALSGLTPTQLEGLLAHELAHIRRHDYVVNLLQSVVETLLFYHPAVWWVSRQIRVEREHCCDDLAVGICDRLAYVSALTDLAAMATPRLALAATDGPLLHRVRRLLRTSDTDSPAAGSVSLVVLLLIVACLVPVMLLSAQSANPTPMAAPVQAEPATASVSRDARIDVAVPAAANVPIARVTTPAGGDVAIQVENGVAPISAATTRALDRARQQLAQMQLTLTEQHPDVLRMRQLVRELEAAIDHPVGSDVRDLQTAADTYKKQVAESEARLKALAQERRGLEREKAEADMRLQLESLRRELESVKAEHERQRQLVAKGVADGTAAAQLQKQVGDIEAMIWSTEAEAKYRLEVENFQQREGEQAREFERLSKDYAELLAKLEDARQLKVAAEMQKEIQPPGTRVAAGDILTVEIQGEDALPRAYVVANDGTIRLPLLGAIRVRELTSAQVEETIAKQLVERKLGATQRVSVTVRRR